MFYAVIKVMRILFMLYCKYLVSLLTYSGLKRLIFLSSIHLLKFFLSIFRLFVGKFKDKVETLNNVAKGTTGSKSEGKKEGCDEEPLVRHPSLNFQIGEQSEAAFLVSELNKSDPIVTTAGCLSS